VRGAFRRVHAGIDDAPVAEEENPIRHIGDRRVVGDQRGGGSEFPIDALNRLENQYAGLAEMITSEKVSLRVIISEVQIRCSISVKKRSCASIRHHRDVM